MRIAYARVSTTEQTLDLQLRALEQAGYDRLYTDEGISGTCLERPGYRAALVALEPGDSLIVWRMDRLARSMRDLTDTVWSLHHRGIGFCSLCETFDLGTAVGQLTLNMLCAIADFERALIVERTKAGIEAAKAKGSVLGRPPALSPAMLAEAHYLISDGLSVPSTAKHLGIGRSTLYRHLAELRHLGGISS
ncbi:MAG: recombinase family protein [Pseudomonadota bacterium]